MPAHQPAQATAKGQTGDSRIRNGSASSGEPEDLGLSVQLPPKHTTFSPGRSREGIHTHALHGRHVYNQPAVVRAIAGSAVTTASHGDADTMDSSEVHCTLHVGDTGTTRNQCRPS